MQTSRRAFVQCRSAGAHRRRAVPADRLRIADAVGRAAHHRGQYRRARPPGGLRRFVAAVPDHRRQAGAARDAGHRRPAGTAEQAPGQGDRGAAAARQDPERGAGPGAAVAARLLSARADEGHPEGTRRAGRRPARNRGTAQEDRRCRHARGREEGSSEGAFASVAHVSHGGRLLADPELHRVAGGAALGQELRLQDRHRQGQARFSTRTTTS